MAAVKDLIDPIFDLLERMGAVRYGLEPVSQLDHALQCAWLAEQEDAPASLIAAALMHDMGHLLDGAIATKVLPSIDRRHEELGAYYLKLLFKDCVARPVALPVEAKRYLCHAEPDYVAALSAGSITSLELQGGPFDATAASAFLDKPFAVEAVRLRRWDDKSKRPGRATPDLEHFRPFMTESLRASEQSRKPGNGHSMRVV